ncbi:hypothetical protein JEQ12_007009 [Ovis aries]|uniref:Uncharacterized protein n=1 Tax=Ovis aries TaxID=9940 RepID=A0A836A0L9_SHEEP|nr:hypothetical protein JEQ12_007009 [Ovis aries]
MIASPSCEHSRAIGSQGSAAMRLRLAFLTSEDEVSTYEEESVRGKLRALVEDKREICPGCDLCFCINKAFLKISKLGVRHSAELTNSFSESRGCWYLSCDGVNGQGRSTPGESYPALAPHRYGLHPNPPDTCHFTPGDPAGKTAHTLCKEQGVPAFLCRQKQQKLLPFPGAAQSTP